MNRQLLFATLAASAAASIAASGASAQARPPAPASGGQTSRHHSAPMQSISAVRGANADATLEPRRPDFVNATAVYPFSEGTIYRVYTAPERVTDIALQPGETLVAVASGDTVRWVVGDTSSGTGQEKRVHVLVKPFSAGLATNLVITTDRRTYHVALASTAGPAMAALSWSYPQDALLAIRRVQQAAEAAAPIAAGLEIESLNFAYEIKGDRPAWRPLRAFDDGRQTFIEFPPSLGVGEAPPLFLVDRKGEAQLVNYRLRGRYYVIDRLFDAAELRLGAKRQQVVRISRRGTSGRRS